MRKNRDRLSLIASVLEATGARSTKTRIMYAARLSYALLEKYLETVIDLRFVRYDGYRYVLTDGGRDFLKQYKTIQDKYCRAQTMLEDLELERENLEQKCLAPTMSVPELKCRVR